ncbi:amino acid permease [Phenylobacterium hankyongense]|uniref:Arginine/agmatine antiporter n=1 Tax=Phenylobacterium hankyongense TaxID=1813876 RepID=A0A328AWF1_9CAUL|nr:amino acid permease [Phenylobacterium hankyongense]RAK58949.1 amino acid permease [Phenylobacterium hankyongense]
MSQAAARRGLGPLTATLLVAGNMIGSGLFLLPASLAAIGSASLIGWAISATGAMALAGVFAMLGVLRPDPDGLVRYPADALHPAAGFVAWAAYWASCWFGNVAIAIAAVGYLAVFLPGLIGPWPTALGAIGVVWLMALANLRGPRLVAWLSGSTLLIGLVPIAAAIGFGFAAFDPAVFFGSWNVSGKPLPQVIPGSLVLIFWAYLGLESATIAAKALDDPKRNLPIAAVGGVALASVVYAAATAAVMGVIPAVELARSTAPFADVVSRLVGPLAGGLVAACALAKTLGTLGGWILVTAEAARSGAASGYLPKALLAENARLPVRGVLLTGALMSMVALVTLSPTLTKQFNALINVAVLANMAMYFLCSLALLRFAGALERPAGRLMARALAVLAAAFCVWTSYAAFAG